MSYTILPTATAGMATVKFHNAGKHPPQLLAGTVTPAVLFMWTKKTESYFKVRGVKDEDKVNSILTCFADLGVINWINDAEEILRTLSFAEFLKRLRKRVLPEHWDEMLWRKSVNRRMAKDESFKTFKNAVQAANYILSGTGFIEDLQPSENSFETTPTDELVESLNDLPKQERTRLKEIPGFEDWCDEIIREDEKQTRKRKRDQEWLIANMAKRQRPQHPHPQAPQWRPRRTGGSGAYGGNIGGQNSASSSNVKNNHCTKATAGRRG